MISHVQGQHIVDFCNAYHKMGVLASVLVLREQDVELCHGYVLAKE